MAVHIRKKNTRQRGSTTHGWGSMKKHRGAGNRGGRGMAGTGKRGDQMKPLIWKDRKYFGKWGFISKSRAPKTEPVNIKTLEDRADSLVKKGQARFENGAYIINLKDLGYNKLLSTGKATKKLMITTDFATDEAADKIKKAGGEVKVLVAKKPRKEKPSANAKKKEPAEESGKESAE
ncbi:uL15 family ribosomal protein [Candidatus Woesearchaeota archaeon]|nr:uL15 family ribosomal protein [Candidatus Woesearchaeota archaeon]